MKFRILTLLLLLCTLSAGAVERSQKCVGVRVGYNTRNESPTAGLAFQYAFSRHFRLAPNADYIFRRHGTDAFAFNLNAHFPVANTANGRGCFYPLTGVSFTNWNYRTSNADGNDDVSTRKARLGLNFGAGVEYMCTPSLKLSIEGKYNLVKSYSSGVFTLGIAYVF